MAHWIEAWADGEKHVFPLPDDADNACAAFIGIANVMRPSGIAMCRSTCLSARVAVLAHGTRSVTTASPKRVYDYDAFRGALDGRI